MSISDNKSVYRFLSISDTNNLFYRLLWNVTDCRFHRLLRPGYNANQEMMLIQVCKESNVIAATPLHVETVCNSTDGELAHSSVRVFPVFSYVVEQTLFCNLK